MNMIYIGFNQLVREEITEPNTDLQKSEARFHKNFIC